MPDWNDLYEGMPRVFRDELEPNMLIQLTGSRYQVVESDPLRGVGAWRIRFWSELDKGPVINWRAWEDYSGSEPEISHCLDRPNSWKMYLVGWLKEDGTIRRSIQDPRELNWELIYNLIEGSDV